VEKSDTLALEWLYKAAEQGLPEAQNLLGVIYGTGQFGVARNDKLAVTWLRRAAVQGYADAEFSLGLAYAEGRGVRKDPQEAYGWMLRASRRGHGPAAAYVKEIDELAAKKREAREQKQ
jgi:TPR repeat protein